VAVGDTDRVIIHVVPPYVEEAPVEGAEAGTEPEVIGEKKEGEEEGEQKGEAPKSAKSEKKPEDKPEKKK
jgi:hypothetical protein